jgi:BsuBI/PstI restriction endonuclease domain
MSRELSRSASKVLPDAGLASRPVSLASREMERIPVQFVYGTEIRLSPGEHSALIRDIIDEFAPRFAPGSVLIYAGDTGDAGLGSPASAKRGTMGSDRFRAESRNCTRSDWQ